jgi:hypothetical protein
MSPAMKTLAATDLPHYDMNHGKGIKDLMIQLTQGEQPHCGRSGWRTALYIQGRLAADAIRATHGFGS